MNKQTENQLNYILQYIESGVKQTEDFAAEQVPLIIQEILMYNGFVSGLLCVLSITALVIMFFAVIGKGWFKNIDKDMVDITSVILFFPLIFPLIVILFLNVSSFLKIVFAPRLYLIEYVSNLIK